MASLEILQVALGGIQLPPARGNGGSGGRRTLQLTTSGAVAVPGSEPTPVARRGLALQQAAFAALLGLGKVVAAEMPSMACIAADTDVRAAGSSLVPVGEMLPGSAAGIDVHGTALRGSVWVAPRLLPTLPSASGSRAVLTAEGAGKHTVLAASALPPSQGEPRLSNF